MPKSFIYIVILWLTALSMRSSLFIRLAGNELLIIVIHGSGFVYQMLAYGLAKAFVSNPVGRACLFRHKTAGNFMFPLGARLEAPKSLPDTVLYTCVIAYFKVQTVVILVTAPMPAVEAVIAFKADGASDNL